MHRKNKILEIFVFDLRSLSLMRIGVAITLLIDLFIRMYNLEAHYTNTGVLPLDGLFRLAWNEHYFSLYTISGSFFMQLILFLLNAYCILCLLAGFRTKLFTILCWIFLISLHNRNPLIHQGGDDLLRLILFWGIFLPWNYYYSIDSEKINEMQKETDYYSVAGFCYMLQVGYVYFFSALFKSSPEWTSEYSALYYALSLDQIVLPAGKIIYSYPALLKAITFIVYYVELLAPFLLIIPFYISRFRSVFIIMITLLHSGIFLCLNVGLFPLIGIVSMIGFFPGSISEEIVNFLKRFKALDLKSYNIGFINNYLKSKVNFNFRETFLFRSVVVLFAVYVLYWNIATVGMFALNNYTSLPGNILRIDQHWGMFSPAVFKDDGWFVFSATTEAGTTIDLLQKGNKVTYAKLAAVTAPFTQDRWRKFSENILLISNNEFRPYYCSYLFNKWNREEEIKIKNLQIIYMKETSLPDYKVDGPRKEILCECY
ncbi:MAG: HTTM domain-containing protein [Cytophagaceae bacterium]|nr:HTTM domain-containing protein [Cytophagaceae bacterium]